jgi:hypothetical protein
MNKITMNKIIFFLASVVAAVTFASEASALPVFARQTGMECAACHFQHFPLLNTFGRSFKANGFTMMGAQGKVEGEHLSIPNTLNMAVLTSFGYEKTNQNPDTSGALKNAGNGVVFLPGVGGEASLFFGGRVSENAGFLSELGLGGAAAALGSAKLPILYEVGDSGTRAGIVPFTTDAQGASYGMELLNTGANAVHQMSNTPGFNGAHANAMSAQQYINTAGAADGIAIVATNPMGFVNITKFQQTGIATGNFASLGSTYLRLAGTFDLGNWDAGVGIQNWRGQSLNASLIAPLAATKATAIDAQLQGALGTMPTGFYASYARAPAVVDPTTGLNTNTYADPNAGGNGLLTRSSFNISGEIGVVPERATLGVAVRLLGKSGVDEGSMKTTVANGTNASDNAIMLTASYKIEQNMLARLTYTKNSGSYWFSNGGTGTTDVIGSTTTTINVYTLF